MSAQSDGEKGGCLAFDGAVSAQSARMFRRRFPSMSLADLHPPFVSSPSTYWTCGSAGEVGARSFWSRLEQGSCGWSAGWKLKHFASNGQQPTAAQGVAIPALLPGVTYWLFFYPPGYIRAPFCWARIMDRVLQPQWGAFPTQSPRLPESFPVVIASWQAAHLRWSRYLHVGDAAYLLALLSSRSAATPALSARKRRSQQRVMSQKNRPRTVARRNHQLQLPWKLGCPGQAQVREGRPFRILSLVLG